MKPFIVRSAVAAAVAIGAVAAAHSTAYAAEITTPHSRVQATPGTPQVRLDRQQIAQNGYGKLDAALIKLAEAAKAGPSRDAITTMQRAAPGARMSLKAPSVVPTVLVEINIKSGDGEAVQAQLRQLGVIKSSQFRNRISAWIPADQLKAAAAIGSIRSMRASMMRSHVGSITSQGDFLQRSEALRASTTRPGLVGQGVTVGVLSDSFSCTRDIRSYDDDVASGDLPAGVQVLAELDGCTGATDEGRGMAQIIYDVAPGTNIKFYTAFNGEADFANGIIALADAGAQVIVDDVAYFDEPYYQDGIVAQAVDQVNARGVTYFSSAGNDARDSYEGSFGTSGQTGPAGTDIAGLPLMNFDSTGATSATVLPFGQSANSGDLYILQWDQSYSSAGGEGARNQLIYCYVRQPAAGVALSASDFIFCAPPNNVGDDPTVIDFEQFDSDIEAGVVVALASGPAPQHVKLDYVALSGDAPFIEQFATNSGTATGHTAARGAGSTGASYFRANPICLPDIYPQFTLEDYSSAGGTPILFDADGNRLATPEIRQKPNFVAPDGGNTTFFASPLGARASTIPQCSNADGTYNFFGTSAAAPHAAGVAALLLQAQPKAKPAEIFTALAKSAIDMGDPGVDFDTGAGFIQADAALTALVPAASLSATSLNFGQVVIRSGTGTQTLTLTNTGGSVLTVGQITVTGAGYTLNSNCGTELAAQSTCTVTVVFRPRSAGSAAGTLSIASDGTSSSVPSQVALSGTGTVPPGGGAFGLMLLLPGFAAALLRRRRRTR